MGCGCNKGSGRWKVVHPDGKTVIKNSEASAKLAQAKIPGSTISRMS